MTACFPPESVAFLVDHGLYSDTRPSPADCPAAPASADLSVADNAGPLPGASPRPLPRVPLDAISVLDLVLQLNTTYTLFAWMLRGAVDTKLRCTAQMKEVEVRMAAWRGRSDHTHASSLQCRQLKDHMARLEEIARACDARCDRLQALRDAFSTGVTLHVLQPVLLHFLCFYVDCDVDGVGLRRDVRALLGHARLDSYCVDQGEEEEEGVEVEEQETTVRERWQKAPRAAQAGTLRDEQGEKKQQTGRHADVRAAHSSETNRSYPDSAFSPRTHQRLRRWQRAREAALRAPPPQSSVAVLLLSLARALLHCQHTALSGSPMRAAPHVLHHHQPSSPPLPWLFSPCCRTGDLQAANTPQWWRRRTGSRPNRLQKPSYDAVAQLSETVSALLRVGRMVRRPLVGCVASKGSASTVEGDGVVIDVDRAPTEGGAAPFFNPHHYHHDFSERAQHNSQAPTPTQRRRPRRVLDRWVRWLSELSAQSTESGTATTSRACEDRVRPPPLKRTRLTEREDTVSSFTSFVPASEQKAVQSANLTRRLSQDVQCYLLEFVTPRYLSTAAKVCPLWRRFILHTSPRLRLYHAARAAVTAAYVNFFHSDWGETCLQVPTLTTAQRLIQCKLAEVAEVLQAHWIRTAQEPHLLRGIHTWWMAQGHSGSHAPEDDTTVPLQGALIRTTSSTPSSLYDHTTPSFSVPSLDGPWSIGTAPAVTSLRSLHVSSASSGSSHRVVDPTTLLPIEGYVFFVLHPHSSASGAGCSGGEVRWAMQYVCAALERELQWTAFTPSREPHRSAPTKGTERARASPDLSQEALRQQFLMFQLLSSATTSASPATSSTAGSSASSAPWAESVLLRMWRAWPNVRRVYLTSLQSRTL